MYPKKLPNNTTETFRLEERLPDNTSIRKAYYHKDDYPINMHSHNFYEINIVVEGNGVHYIEDNLCLAKPGDVFAIPPKNRHGYWSENDLNIFHLLLPHYVLEKYSDELEKFSGYHTLFEIEPYIRKNYDESIFLHLTEEQLARLRPEMENILYDLQQEESEESNLIFEMRAILLICTLSRLIDTDYRMQLPDTTQPDALSIVKTIEYMRKEFSEKISIDDLARKANMSRSTYLRRFTAICKTTPTEYLAEIRIKKACELLKNANLSVTDVAQACGFFDCSHFIRVFSKYRGTTPRNYRQTILTRF